MPPVRRVHACVLSAAAAVALLLAACGSSASTGSPSPRSSAAGPTKGGSPPSSSVPAQGSGCVTQSQATAIWTGIDNKLNAMEADPKNADPSTAATGTALQGVRQYLQQMLVANNWSEHEVDKLESLSIIAAGCSNGPLTVRVTMTLVTDDYLRANGQLDHHDAQTGKTLHFIDTYVRSAGSWKESDFQDLDQPAPTQTPQLV